MGTGATGDVLGSRGWAGAGGWARGAWGLSAAGGIPMKGGCSCFSACIDEHPACTMTWHDRRAWWWGTERQLELFPNPIGTCHQSSLPLCFQCCHSGRGTWRNKSLLSVAAGSLWWGTPHGAGGRAAAAWGTAPSPCCRQFPGRTSLPMGYFY